MKPRVFLTMVSFVAIQPQLGFSEDQEPRDVLDVLEMLTKGYEANNKFLSRIHVEGRLYQTQHAQEGKSIPPEKVLKPEWKSFRYVAKDGKRRYEEVQPDRKDKPLYVLDTGEQIVSYATGNRVALFPIPTDRSQPMPYTDQFFEHFAVPTGEHDLPNTLVFLTEKAKEGRFDGEGNHLTWEVDEAGVFRISAKVNGWHLVLLIDSMKGYNMVEGAVTEDYGEGRYWQDTKDTVELKEYAPGKWYPKSARVDAVERDVVVERRLEIDKVSIGDFEYPDELFQIESLSIPPNTYTVDTNFDPPLRIRPSQIAKDIELDMETLLAAGLERNQVVSVGPDGAATTTQNTPYVESRSEEAAVKRQAVNEDSSWRRAVAWWVPLAALALAILGAAAFISRKRGVGRDGDS